MLNKEKIEENNYLLLSKLSAFLNNNSNSIKKEMLDSLMKEFSFSVSEAYAFLLSSFLELDDNSEIFNNYFSYMIKELDINKYLNNPYYKNIKISDIKYREYSFKNEHYEPFEAFVYNDLKRLDDGRIIPQIGFFKETYEYPAILENAREWMLITPNEIETMESVIDESFGHVLTYGLGLGYFAYMTSLKENVIDVTIVENDQNVIDLFNKYILNQFDNKEKIKVIKADAFEFAKNKTFNYDFVFADIWHDPSDGVELYLKFKKLEKSGVTYKYWIEETLKCYL